MGENGSLSRKAMLVNLSISQWTARKYDRKVSKEVADKYGAAEDAGRYSKVLIALEEVKKIGKIANAARTWHYTNSLPWNDSGDRILPAANYERYEAGLTKLAGEFWEAVNKFVEVYPELKEDARGNLAGLFNAEDYPEAGALGAKYAFRPSFSPLALAADFRAEIADEAAATIRQDIETRIEAQQKTAMADLWQRLYQGVKHMAEKLADPEAIFRDSLVDNLAELAEVLPALNFANDQQLEAMATEVMVKLTAIEPDTLRTAPLKRREVATDAAALLKAITGAGSRFIDLSE